MKTQKVTIALTAKELERVRKADGNEYSDRCHCVGCLLVREVRKAIRAKSKL
jgi:hypothetical protein